MRKQQFKRPEPGFSLYEGRTRGKRMKYTYSDDEDDFLTDSTTRRSTRNTRNHTPAEPAGPVVTASGRQIRAPTRLNVETVSNGAPSASGSVQGDAQLEDVDMDEGDSVGPTGRPRRSAAVKHGLNGWPSKKRKSEEYESDEDEEGSEPDFGDDEEEEEHVPDESDEDEEEFEEDVDVDDDLDDDAAKPQLIIKLPIKAAVDTDGRARIVPGTPLSAERPKSSRPVHRNVIVSDESESTEGPDSKATTVNEPEEKAAEVISVAVKGTKHAPDMHAPDSSITAATTPLTPSRGQPTSLAFRESPEKPPPVPRPIGVGSGE